MKSALQLFKRVALYNHVIVNNATRLGVVNTIQSRNITSTPFCGKEVRQGRETFKVGSPSKYIGNVVTGEVVSSGISSDLFPDEHTPNKIFNGIPYKELPIVNIKASSNNTIMTLTTYKGLIKHIYSCGRDGFKNARKRTNVAAQQTAITFGRRAIELGRGTVRVRVQGLGAGREASLKGLQIAGVNIISITDDTRVSWYPPRARKPRRI